MTTTGTLHTQHHATPYHTPQPNSNHAPAPAQVSIVPRGSAALGFAQYLPNENVLMTTEQMNDMICMALGGRAAEQVGGKAGGLRACMAGDFPHI